MKLLRFALMVLGVASALFVAMVMALGEDLPEGADPNVHHFY